MKGKIILFVLTISALNFHAEDGHNLWLRGKSTGSVNVVFAKCFSIQTIVKQRYEQGRSGGIGLNLLYIKLKSC